MSVKFIKILLTALSGYGFIFFIRFLSNGKMEIESENSKVFPNLRHAIAASYLSLQSKFEIAMKVRNMNEELESIRRAYLSNFNISTFKTSAYQTPRTFLREDDPEYYRKIKNFSCVTLLTMAWNRTATVTSVPALNNNSSHDGFMDYNRWLLHTKYYRFTASELLCQWIINDDVNSRYGYIYNYTCNTDINLASNPTSINPLFINSRAPLEKGKIQPTHRFQMPTEYHAMQVFTNSVVVSNMGEPFCDNLQVRPDDCLQNPSDPPSPSSVSTFPYFKEVFVISQFWGGGYFHRMIENIPRIAFFLEFILKHPTIKILAYDKSEKLLEILESLGISRDRVISGWTISDIVYVPRSTSCGTPNLMEMQFFQYYNTRYILENLVNTSHHIRNKLILIKRSGSRKFSNVDTIEKLLTQVSDTYGYEFVIFKDNPSPSLNDTMLLFHLASIVVAPHGAGLSNLIFGRPGTLVIEGLCNRPIVNLCYHRTSYALGMRWYGIPALKGCEGVIDVKGEDINFVLRSYLQIIHPTDLKK